MTNKSFGFFSLDQESAARSTASLPGKTAPGSSSNSGTSDGSERRQRYVSGILKFGVSSHWHPSTDTLINELSSSGFGAFSECQADTPTDLQSSGPFKFDSTFISEDSSLTEGLQFSPSEPYAVYDWELFYFAPLTIAIQLSKNRRFAEAQRWFHFIFDPTSPTSDASAEGLGFWKFKPFQNDHTRSPEALLILLAKGPSELTDEEKKVRTDLLDSLHAWTEAPYQPHVVAAYRPWAYMIKTVTAYVDNLLDWGDALFAQDTRESVNEALQLYLLASSILGPRGQKVPRLTEFKDKSYDDLAAESASQIGSVLTDLGATVDGGEPVTNPRGDTTRHAANDLLRTLYFNAPANDRLLAYWDKVADRLYKIRHSQNLAGSFRKLALWDPPVDPALLARAAAAGVDVGAIVREESGAQTLSQLRFQVWIQKALELCSEVKSLGSALLTAFEKQDGEALARLRSRHESNVLSAMESIKCGQLHEARKTREGLEKSREAAIQRYVFFERQLGNKQEKILSSIPALDEVEISRLWLSGAAQPDPQIASSRELAIDIDDGLTAKLAGALSGGHRLSQNEKDEVLLLETSQLLIDQSALIEAAAATLRSLPQTAFNLQPFGAGSTLTFGPNEIANAVAGVAGFERSIATRMNFEAQRASRMGSYARRELEWSHQSNQAAAEINTLTKQWRAAQIREALAQREVENHRRQMSQAQEVDQFLSGSFYESGHRKVGIQELYAWMVSEVRSLYSQCFDLAYSVAKKAERALHFELQQYKEQLPVLKYDYRAGREGLLAGERLHQDLRRLEIAYMENRRRDLELTKHISLSRLKDKDGKAITFPDILNEKIPIEFELTKMLFDEDCPGMAFRRIKSVALTIPCVAGPYASVTAILRQKSHTIDGWNDKPLEHPMYSEPAEIITSHGQNDYGLFEPNLKEDIYMPFEGTGAISSWELVFPQTTSTLDLSTISDVILHLRYTAIPISSSN